MEPVLDVPDERSPQVMAYWAKRGMVKEFHGYDEPTDWDDYEAKPATDGKRRSTGSFKTNIGSGHLLCLFRRLPLRTGRKKYPVVFALHGACNNIFLVEGWGFVQEAARREMDRHHSVAGTG